MKKKTLISILLLAACLCLSASGENSAADAGKTRSASSRSLEVSGHLYQKYMDQGIYYLQLGDYEKAKDSLWKAVELKPDLADAYVNLGIVEIQLKNWESAQRILIKAKRLASGDYLKKDILLYNLGLSFQMADQPQNAIPYYIQATQVIRNFGEAIFNLGVCYLQTGDKDKALIEISRARSIFEDNHQVPMIQQADRTLMRIMNASNLDSPSFAKQLLEKSRQYAEKEDTDSAIAIARVSIIIFPQYIDAYQQLGIYYVQQGDVPKAVQCFKSALGLKPTFAPAYIEMGKIHENAANYNLSLTNYFKALKLDDTNPFIYYKIGLIHQKTGRNLKAREWFRKAKVLALKKNDADLLAEIDRVYKIK